MGDIQSCCLYNGSKEHLITNIRVSKQKIHNVNDDYEYEYERNIHIPQKSIIAINGAQLISNLITNFFKADVNRCEYIDDADINDIIRDILDNIFIIGGACRDLLLIKPINDLNLVCNTRELNKIHLRHLKKYHSVKTHQNLEGSCILWDHYLNKFNESTQLYDLNILKHIDSKDVETTKTTKNSYEYIRNCDYILNAKYIADIIANSKELFAKHIDIVREIGIIRVVTIIINQPFIYNKYDLNQQDFDFLDVCKHDFKLKYVNMREIEKNKMYHQGSADVDADDHFFHSKFRSIEMDSPRKLVNINEKGEPDDLITIDAPIYDTGIDVHVGSADFSINCVYLSLSSIVSATADAEDITIGIYNDIIKEIKGIPVYNITKDLKLKLLTTTLQTVLHETPQIHFWRVIKFGVRLYNDGWRINPDLINFHKALYYQWIDDDTEYLKDVKNIAYFIKKMFNDGFATNVSEYVIMVKVFHTLAFNWKLIAALKRNELFKAEWMKVLNEKGDDVVSVFKQNKYPVYDII